MRRRTDTATRTRLSADQRRRAILDATISGISKFGYWGVTIRDVADAVGLTEAGLLYYFNSKEQLLIETIKHADSVNQIAIAKRLGGETVTGEVLEDGIAFHCDLGLKTISTATVETNQGRPELVRLYMMIESEALSSNHPAHEYFARREDNLIREYTLAASRDGADDPERTALQVLSAMDGLQLRWLYGARNIDFVAEWKALIELIIPGRG